jgi:hypothetical protein
LAQTAAPAAAPAAPAAAPAAPPAPAAAQPVNLGAQTAATCALPDAEYTAYNNAMAQSNPQAKAAGIEKYLTDFPTSACPAIRVSTMVILMTTYSQFDVAKTLDAADRILKLDPNNLRALYGEAVLRKSAADALTDPAAKQAALDTAADYAQKGIAAFAAPKPADMPDADYQTLKASATPSFYSIIGFAAFNKNDNATAIDAYKKELASVPLAATKAPGQVLQDTFFLGSAYFQAKPPDYLSCSFYASRAVAYAPDSFKTQMSPTAKYCYKKYHDGDDGYDAIVASATANLNPPDGFFATIKPGLTPAEKIHAIIASTPDLSTLATEDKEMVFQFGSPDDAAKVWDTIKGKSFQISGVVITTSPAVLTLAVTPDAIQSKAADYTVNMAPAEDVPELKATATLAQKAAYKKEVAAAQAKAGAIGAATAVGQTVNVSGTYDSFTPNPVQIIMKDGDVVLAKAAAKPAARTATKAAAPAHRATATKK